MSEILFCNVLFTAVVLLLLQTIIIKVQKY